MSKKNIGFENLNYSIILFCFFSFSTLYSQINFSREVIDKKYKGRILSSQKQGEFLEESKILNKKTDTITFVFDDKNIAKLITIKNQTARITDDKFHKYASEINPKFRFHSKLENTNTTIYFNEEKDLVNIKIFADSAKNILIEVVFISGQKMIQKLVPHY
ncbi:hypothetical protein H4V97_000126 [Flavobacterium sp. CG_23.5]|uniref:hypothetical protein n=1 Tax=unclassified Flavobacterium TaxID=196869 RepID=UPI0018CA9AE8|nr:MULTISPECIES: hypothetical protein [unclassified Flavobacterium]MBG6110195.1 hypothetical protein [Flavobacterium sp. CG_9.10]MBP2281808.1 hypothetical protein [Flavobacterium sp. CG_23.5]